GSRGLDVVVATGSRRGVSPVPVVVARRRVLPRTLRLQSCVSTPRLVEAPCADQLVVALRGWERLTNLTLAVPALEMVVRLPILLSVTLRLGAIGEAWMLWPDA